MSEQEEESYDVFLRDELIAQQAAELAALRGFSIEMFHYDFVKDETLLKYGLIDESGNPTALLTGGNETADGDASV